MWTKLTKSLPDDGQIVLVKMEPATEECKPDYALAKYHLSDNSSTGYYFEPEGVYDTGGNNWMSLVNTVIAWMNVDKLLY